MKVLHQLPTIATAIMLALPSLAMAGWAAVFEKEGISTQVDAPKLKPPSKILCTHETGPIPGAMMTVAFNQELGIVAPDTSVPVTEPSVTSDAIRYTQSGFTTHISRVNGKFSVISLQTGRVTATGSCEAVKEARKF